MTGSAESAKIDARDDDDTNAQAKRKVNKLIHIHR